MEVIGTSSLELRSMREMSEREATSVGINALMLCREGTIPGSRAFGLKQDYLSAPDSDIALNILGIELQEKLDKYMPGVSVKKVSGERDTDGRLKASIEVERRQ